MILLTIFSLLLAPPLLTGDREFIERFRSEVRVASEKVIEQTEVDIDNLYELRVSILALWQIEQVFDRVEVLADQLNRVPAELLDRDYAQKYEILKLRLSAFKEQVSGRMNEIILGRSEVRRAA